MAGRKRITTKQVVENMSSRDLRAVYKYCQQIGYAKKYAVPNADTIHFRKIEELESYCLDEMNRRKIH